MNKPLDFRPLGCQECKKPELLGFDFSMAFQPIVDANSGSIFAHEALVRGAEGEPAGAVFDQVHEGNLYRFDQSCRTKAISLAAELGLSSYLHINFMPNAVYRPELCIRTTLEAAEHYGFPLENIIFEITESEEVRDMQHLRGIVDYYRSRGFKIAIDDFGAGYAGLNLLSEVPADILKLDMALIRGVDQDRVRHAIVRGVLQVCNELDIKVIAEGVETREEYLSLREMGIELYQGYYFARPRFEGLATVDSALLENS